MVKKWKDFWTKSTLQCLVLGQILSLLVTTTGFTSSLLAKKGFLILFFFACLSLRHICPLLTHWEGWVLFVLNYTPTVSYEFFSYIFCSGHIYIAILNLSLNCRICCTSFTVFLELCTLDIGLWRNHTLQRRTFQGEPIN